MIGLGALILATVVTLVIVVHGNVSTESAPLPSSVTRTPTVSSTPNTTAQDRTQLPQALGSVVFLLTKQHVQSGTYPTTLVADSGGLVTVESGSVRLPTDSRFSYIASADGKGFQLALTGASGLVARYDSGVGTISVG